MPSAVEKLKPSKLTSDQRELLGNDVDLGSLQLVVKGRTGFQLLESVTGGDIERTIDGASTVTIQVLDRDRTLLRSGLLSKDVDINIDGLWFRLVAFVKTGSALTLTFEDREVALLRRLPLKGAPHNGYLAVSVTKTTRTQFARRLVREVKEVEIPFICPALDGAPDPAANQTTKDTKRAFGFAPGANVTVKNAAATPEQLRNIAAVLDVGISMILPRKVLVVAIMTITQEASARTSATNGVHVGLFQQDPRYWPATRDPATDARAFYERAIQYHRASPQLDYFELAEKVQASGQGSLYAQWRAEAEHTVTAYGISGGTAGADPFEVPTVSFGTSEGQFTRGTSTNINGKRTFKREDNWATLQRLASEINWRAFCVSGAVYFISDADLFKSRPRMTISEDTDGVDSIDGDYDTGQKTAKLIVACRIDRWAAPPGSVVIIENSGPLDGRWLVKSTKRPIFKAAGTVNLEKPEPALPESQSPEFASSTPAEGGITFDGDIAGGGESGGIRAGIVAAAERALQQRDQYRYRQKRPMAKSLGISNPQYIDCSEFATLAYKAGGAPDPNGLGYNGAGYTGTLVQHGEWTKTPRLGDLCFYGGTRSIPGHVTVFVGDGKCIGIGGPAGFLKLDTDYRGDFLGFMTYDLSPADSSQERHRHRD